MCRTLARESPLSTTRGSAFPDWAGLARALVQPSSWRRMGLRWTATATSMLARCRGPTGRKLSETSHDQVICARCTSSGRWYRSANAPVYPWVTLRGQATSRSSSISSTNSALRRADRCRDIRHCGQFNESEAPTALIRGDARTEKTELENGLAEAARASHQAAGDR